MFKTIMNWFSAKPVIGSTVRIARKKSDVSLLTQYDYDFIMDAYGQWRVYNLHNPENRKTQVELCITLNSWLKKDKTIGVYRRVWQEKVDRNSLPTGIPIEGNI